MVDHEHGDLRETLADDVLQVCNVLGRCVVDEDDDPRAMRLQSGDGLYRRHEVGGRLIRQWDDADGGEFCRLNHAALDEASEVKDERLARVACGNPIQDLARLERDDAVSRKRRFVNVGGAVVEVVGNEHAAAVLGISNGVRGLTLPSFDGVEKHGHNAIVIG